jgi:hypothetical protein
VYHSLYRRWLVGSRGIFPEYTTTPSSPHQCSTATAERAQSAEVEARARPSCDPSPSSLTCGSLDTCTGQFRGGLGLVEHVGLGLFLFCLGLYHFMCFLLFSWPNYDVISYITCKTRNFTKTMKIVSVKVLSTLFW